MKIKKGFVLRQLLGEYVITGEGLLMDRYEVDKETALKDSETLVKSWNEAGLVE